MAALSGAIYRKSSVGFGELKQLEGWLVDAGLMSDG